MMIYSGVRPSEMLAVRKADVKLKQRYFIVRESKTEAGENRAVPISRKALPTSSNGCRIMGKLS